MVEVKGKGCISVKIIADSISEDGVRIVTAEWEYPRFIHGEIMTHRLFSRNAMSSRAVPVEKMIEQVRNNPAMPVHWGANQPGMQADIEIQHVGNAKDLWRQAANKAADMAEEMMNIGLHKQAANRLLEPFQIMKTIVTSTCWDNFFWLRCHKDAQPEFKELAECMYKAYQESETKKLKAGQWHLPYVQTAECMDTGEQYYFTGFPFDSDKIDLETAQKVSASCCAQVSFRANDTSVDKALRIYGRLVESKPVHASPFEHIATPINVDISAWDEDTDTPLNCLDVPATWEKGITHIDRSDELWSGNLKGWIQYRQLIDGNTCWKYNKEEETL